MEENSESISNTLSILIIDDEPVDLKVMSTTLSGEGYQVYESMTSEKGLKMAKRYLPKLILLDVNLSDGSGFAVLEKLKADVSTSTIPVIFLTGQDDIASKIRGFELGAVDYLLKPIHPKELKIRVRILIRLYQAQAEQIRSQAEKK